MKISIRLNLTILLILLLTAFTQCTSAQSDGIKFFEGSYKDVMKKSKETHKPVMIDMSTSWCGWCKKMKAGAFMDTTAANYYNKNFICIELDGEHGDGLKLAQQFTVNAYPTLIFLSPDEHLILFSEGYLGASDLIKAGEMALKNWKQ